MSHGFEITCRCGHRADIDAFTGTGAKTATSSAWPMTPPRSKPSEGN